MQKDYAENYKKLGLKIAYFRNLFPLFLLPSLYCALVCGYHIIHQSLYQEPVQNSDGRLLSVLIRPFDMRRVAPQLYLRLYSSVPAWQ